MFDRLIGPIPTLTLLADTFQVMERVERDQRRVPEDGIQLILIPQNAGDRAANAAQWVPYLVKSEMRLNSIAT